MAKPAGFEIHSEYDNTFQSIPFIEEMKVTEYIMTVKVIRRACFVKNKVRFTPEHENQTSEEESVRQSSKFVYRLHSGARMNRFVARIFPQGEAQTASNTVTITAKIEDIKLAEQQFNDARADDKAAVLTKLDEHATDSFIIELGQIPDRHEVSVEFDYFMDLKIAPRVETRGTSTTSHTELIRLFIPMEKKGRYFNPSDPPPELNSAKSDTQMNTKMYIICEPKARNITGKMPHSGAMRTITKHEVTEMNPTERWVVDSGQMKASVEDLELYIDLPLGDETPAGYITDAFECHTASKESIYVMNLNPDEVRKAIDDSAMDMDDDLDDGKDKEYIFLVDRSGSMSGGLMRNAKKALELFVKQLPEDCKFNIYSFGSKFSKLWAQSRICNADSTELAVKHIQEMSANYGGTQIYSVLNEILTKRDATPQYETDGNDVIVTIPITKIRDIIILTDGGVSNTQTVLDLVAQHKQQNRIFSVGIGSGASTELVDGVAKESNGESIYVLSDDRMQSKVMQLAQQTMKPVLTLTKISFPQLNEYLIDQNQPARQLHAEIRLFYKFKKLKSKFFDKYQGKPIDIQMEFSIGEKQFTVERQFMLKSVDNHGLLSYYASQKIEELERTMRNERGTKAEELKSKIIEFSKAGNVLHRLTAFIGVADRPNEPNPVNLVNHLQNDIAQLHLQSRHTGDMVMADSFSPSTGPPPMMLTGGYRQMKCGGMPKSGGMSMFGNVLCGSARPKQRPQQQQKMSFGMASSNESGMVADCADGMVFSADSFGGSASPKKKKCSKPADLNSKDTHEVIVDLADFTGFWSDTDTLWTTLARYDARIVKAELEKFRGDMETKVFLTIIVLVILNQYAKEFKTEWSLMTRKSRKFIKSAALSPDRIGKVESDLRNFINKTN